ncbi:MAG: hypothetical protein GXO43_01820 [Crenarchaeota archaeon]|nr:hypothetical protein [Thermoproteota archaeon]
MSAKTISGGVAGKSNSKSHCSGQASVSTTKYVITLYPSTSTKLFVKIHGPPRHVVSISEEAFPYTIANLNILPRQGKAPFQAEIIITAKNTAKPGTYTWKLKITDETTNTVLAEKQIIIIIKPRNHYTAKLQGINKIYRKYGIQAALWTAIKKLYPNGATFKQIHTLYKHITQNNNVSKGTVGNTLSIMLKKKLLVKINRGKYRAINLNQTIALSRINTSRVRYPWQTHRAANKKKTKKTLLQTNTNLILDILPKPIQRAYIRAKEITKQHGPLTGLYFMLHTLLGARQTGHLLLWLDELFIILERKTGFCHHYYSYILCRLLHLLGLEEGTYYNPEDPEHRKARKTAQKYIRKYYGSHQNARRLHYMLREEDLIWSDNKVYTIKIYHYTETIGIEIYDYKGQELLYTNGVQANKTPVKIETITSMPYHHIRKKNEETYFHRPSNIY